MCLSDDISVCTGSAKRPYSEYLSLIDCRTNDPECRAWDPDLAGDKTTRVVATCRAYANYRPFSRNAQPTDPVQVIAPDNRAQGDVRWRYITRDGKYVMVHDRKGRASGGAIWVFVSRGCVTNPPRLHHLTLIWSGALQRARSTFEATPERKVCRGR